ncbi:hypothetical protein AGLY_017949 [Aphis glycines]|uniref:Uncharacterized protein n=1 Tax=Aphis glycines TaxID=307491 RepID=A0A6G0STG6_APHGL|nr:hypothetical protein AGLY_017949 [Aphis glycines]
MGNRVERRALKVFPNRRDHSINRIDSQSPSLTIVKEETPSLSYKLLDPSINMNSQPGPSRERSPVVTRRKTLTDEQLLALLQGSNVDDRDSDFEVDIEESDSKDNSLTEADIPEIRHSISSEHWSSNPVHVPLIPFIGNAGLKVQPKRHEPIDYFDLLVSDDFYNFIVEETNLYAIEVLSLSSEKSRITHWKDLTTTELKVFLGLLYHTGTIRLNKLEDYWKQDDLFNIPCFKKNMSRNRFLLILRVLHFSHDAVDPNDRLFKIKSIVKYFNNKMDEVYYPGKNLSIDESMILWRAEPNGLNLNIMIYTGQKLSQLEQPHSKSHTENVVINLMEGKLFKGVDRQNQLMSYYPCERKTLRWYKKVGIHILQQLLLNSYLLYCQNEQKQNEITTKLPTAVPFVHTLQLLPKSEKTTKVQRKRCSYCKEIGKRKDTSYYCSLCPQNPPLCLGSCFENYHAK